MCSKAAASDLRYLTYLKDLEGHKTLKTSLNLKEIKESALRNGCKEDEGDDEDEDAQVGIALFGLGRIGSIHFENLVRNPRVRLLYCVDYCEERMAYLKRKWKLPDIVMLTPQHQDVIFEDPRVEAVVICTPTNSHFEIAIKALDASKSVFCEKPLAHDYEGIKRCFESAEGNKKTLLCAFNRRFDPGFRSVKERLDAGEVGPVHVIKTCSRDSPLPSVDYLSTSGGIFHDCAVHDIDLICWMLGEYPISVSAQSHAFIAEIKALDDFDTVAIVMKFASGALGIIDLSRFASYGYDQRIEVFGPRGMLTSSESRPTNVRYHCEEGSTAVPIYYCFVSRYQESYANECQHFIDVLRGLTELEVQEEEILAVSRIASACEEAARTGNSVQLTWGEKGLQHRQNIIAAKSLSHSQQYASPSLK